jgi:hypothetical protein
MLTRQEKEKLVIDLYNQGMTIREIAKKLRMSFRDIGAILKKASGEVEENQEKKQSSLSPSAQAYQLFSLGRAPIDVAISLDLSESETTEYYREYLDLMQLYELKMVYNEIGPDTAHFLRLFRILKKEQINSQHIVNLFSIANNDLPALERRYHRLNKDVVLLKLEKQKSEQMGSQVRILAKMCEDYKQQIGELHRKKIALESLIREFENDKGYKMIRRIAKEEVNNTLSENKDLLKIAVASVLESIGQDPDRYIFLINSNRYHPGQYSVLHPNVDAYRNLILSESHKLFELMAGDLTNSIINERALAVNPSQTTR